MDYICDEVVPFVDERYPTLAGRDHRGLAGKSSGGYGAMVVPMLRPDVFGALASHAGDALFESCYLRDFPTVARELRDRFDSSYDVFFERLRQADHFDFSRFGKPFEIYGYACAYSPDPERPGEALLPFEVSTGRLIDAMWERWLEHDPVRMAAGHADALRSMRRIYLDAGRGDEYFLDLGAQAFAAELDEARRQSTRSSCSTASTAGSATATRARSASSSSRCTSRRSLDSDRWIQRVACGPSPRTRLRRSRRDCEATAMTTTADHDLIFSGPAALAELVRTKEVHPRELVELCLQRIEALNPRLNAFRVTMADEALAAAADPPSGPLAGVPIAIKDDLPVAGQATTRGSRSYGSARERRRRGGAQAARRRRDPDRDHERPGADDLPVDRDRRPTGSRATRGI